MGTTATKHIAAIAFGIGMAMAQFAPTPAAAEPLNLPYLDNEALLAVMKFNMEDMFETMRRNERNENMQQGTKATDGCNVNIGVSENEGQNDFAIFEQEPAIIVNGPIINACGD